MCIGRTFFSAQIPSLVLSLVTQSKTKLQANKRFERQRDLSLLDVLKYSLSRIVELFFVYYTLSGFALVPISARAGTNQIVGFSGHCSLTNKGKTIAFPTFFKQALEEGNNLVPQAIASLLAFSASL